VGVKFVADKVINVKGVGSKNEN